MTPGFMQLNSFRGLKEQPAAATNVQKNIGERTESSKMPK